MAALFAAIGGLVFIAFAALVAGFTAESSAVRIRERVERVRRSSGVIVAGTQLDAELSKSLLDRLVIPALFRFRGQIMSLAPSEAVNAARKKLDRAGTSVSLTVGGFLLLRLLAIVTGVVGAGAVFLLWPWPGATIHRLAVAGVVIVMGALGPHVYVDSRIRARQATIRRSLPDVIDLLVVSAEAGTGLDGALAVVIKRKQGPLVEEFRRVLTEMRLGKSRQEGWEDMAERVGLDELRMLVAALRQAEQLGVSIAKTLRTQADSLRTARSLRVRQIAASLSIKMLFPLIFCILPALFITVLGPGLMELTSTFKDLGW
jgi:tight adherence protein C